MKTLKSLIGLFFLICCFISCKKTDEISNKTTQNENTESKKITTWLNAEAKKTTSFRGEIITSVLDNLDFNLQIESFIYNKRKITVIPIKDGFKNDNNSTRKVMNYLVVKENLNNNKLIGTIVQYIINDKYYSEDLIQKSIMEIHINNKSLVNGQFTFLTIADVFILDKNYKDGVNTLDRYVSTNPNYEQKTNTNCTDWYWVNYNTFTGEIISYEYLYTSCDCLSLRTNPEGNRMVDPDACTNGGGVGLTNAWLWEQCQELLGGAPGSDFIHNQILNIQVPTSVTSLTTGNNSYTGYTSSYWQLEYIYQYKAKINGDLTIYAENSAFVHTLQVNFGAIETLFGASYTPSATVPDYINFNNTNYPKGQLLRNGLVNVGCKLAGKQFINLNGTARETLDVNFNRIP